MITKENYEEYFLLYTDNELSAAERHEVERFVADHPDLRDEWEALLQCRLSPDPPPAFPGRDSLLKPELEGSPYTGTLLAWLDGELNNEDAARIAAILREQPRVATELAILRQTVTHPDLSVVFPEKARLYRSEKGKRIIPLPRQVTSIPALAASLPWLRIGVAAAVAGTIVLLWLLPAKHPPVANTLAGNNVPNSTLAGKTPDGTTHPDSTANIHKITPAVTPAPARTLHFTEGHPKTHPDRPAIQLIQKRKPQQPRDVAQKMQQPTDIAANNARNETNNNQDGTPSLAAHEGHPADAPATIDPTRTATIGSLPPATDIAVNVRPAPRTGIPKEQSSFATQALQEEANDEHSFIADETAAPGKARFRGIFRKVTRAFTKTGNRDSDGNRQVLVGAFQVSL